MSNFSMKKYGYLGEFVIIDQEHLISEVYYIRLYIIITQLKNLTKNALDLSYEILDYKLCNETSMANYTNSFILDIELEKLYCIEMDYINMGGGWDTEFINYVELDLFSCANGIDFDENNKNCST